MSNSSETGCGAVSGTCDNFNLKLKIFFEEIVNKSLNDERIIFNVFAIINLYTFIIFLKNYHFIQKLQFL